MLLRTARFGLGAVPAPGGRMLPEGTALENVVVSGPEAAFDWAREIWFNITTGEVYGAAPPAGISPLTWVMTPQGVKAGYGPAWVAQTAAEAAELKAITEAQLAAQKAGTAQPSLPAYWAERTSAAQAPAAPTGGQVPAAQTTTPAGVPTTVELPGAVTGAFQAATGWLSGQTMGIPNFALAAGAGLAAVFLFRGGGGRRRGGF